MKNSWIFNNQLFSNFFHSILINTHAEKALAINFCCFSVFGTIGLIVLLTISGKFGIE